MSYSRTICSQCRERHRLLLSSEPPDPFPQPCPPESHTPTLIPQPNTLNSNPKPLTPRSLPLHTLSPTPRPLSPQLFRGTSLRRNRPLVRPYSSSLPRALCWSDGGGAVSCVRGTPVSVTSVRNRRGSGMRYFLGGREEAPLHPIPNPYPQT